MAADPDESFSPNDDDSDVIYALRAAHHNQTQLNVMADQKANILVGLIVIPMSILLTRVSTLSLESFEFYAAMLFVACEAIAIVFGILVIRPRMRWRYQKQGIDQLPNPLFFGFFCNIPEDDYVQHMLSRLDSNGSAREILLRDYYQVGHVLRRKFMLLKFAYLFAAGGMLLGLAALFLSMAGVV